MARYMLCALTQPQSPELEEEFNKWYDEVHVPDTLNIPGVLSAQRYKMRPESGWLTFPHTYLALYEVETDDLNFIDQEIRRRRGGELMLMTEAIAPISQRFFVEAIGTPMTSEDAKKIIAERAEPQDEQNQPR
ncbi:MAG: hypothetical protein KIS86_04410 [Devosia sp.]|nr:hypothetical protein [Devosia sp.]